MLSRSPPNPTPLNNNFPTITRRNPAMKPPGFIVSILILALAHFARAESNPASLATSLAFLILAMR